MNSVRYGGITWHSSIVRGKLWHFAPRYGYFSLVRLIYECAYIGRTVAHLPVHFNTRKNSHLGQ